MGHHWYVDWSYVQQTELYWHPAVRTSINNLSYSRRPVGLSHHHPHRVTTAHSILTSADQEGPGPGTLTLGLLIMLCLAWVCGFLEVLWTIPTMYISVYCQANLTQQVVMLLIAMLLYYPTNNYATILCYDKSVYAKWNTHHVSLGSIVTLCEKDHSKHNLSWQILSNQHDKFMNYIILYFKRNPLTHRFPIQPNWTLE